MKLKRFGALAIATIAAVIIATQVGVVGAQAAGGAIITSSDCTAHTLAANDDGSTAPVDLPFNVNFYGQTYSSLWVNNNGNVTFDGPLSTYTPFGLQDAQIPIIAPSSRTLTRGVRARLRCSTATVEQRSKDTRPSASTG